MICFMITQQKFIRMTTLGYQFMHFSKQFVWPMIINYFEFFMMALLGYIQEVSMCLPSISAVLFLETNGWCNITLYMGLSNSVEFD